MATADKYKIINIRRYIGNDNPELGEDVLLQILSEFSCPMNPDVERFLKKAPLSLPKRTSLLHIWCFQSLVESCLDILLLH